MEYVLLSCGLESNVVNYTYDSFSVGSLAYGVCSGYICPAYVACPQKYYTLADCPPHATPV